MKSKITLFCLAFILVSGVVYSQYYLDYETDGTGSSYYEEYSGNSSVIAEWYEVSDAEIEFCKNYGGTIEGQDVYGSAGYTQPVSTLTLTLQGQYTTLYDTTLYEIAWYVHPLAEDITYTIYLVTEEGESEELYTGYSTALDGDAGYETQETNIVYTHAKIIMEDSTTALTVPFVEKTTY